jgi:hypothetical protein
MTKNLIAVSFALALLAPLAANAQNGVRPAQRQGR